MASTFHLIGFPTDCNSSFERGPAEAPAAVRAALWSPRGNMACENGMEIGLDFQLVDKGDLALGEDAQDDDLITAAVLESLRDGAVPILLGGDHAVTHPVMRAIHAQCGPVTVLHFDAHPDLYDSFDGNPRSHASPFARIMENQLAARLIQVGIRTLNRHCREQVERFGIDVFDMRRLAAGETPNVEGPVYISFDLDGLDPAFAPGVSHPEPGGLSVRDVLSVLDRVSGRIVGADIVELNPRFDINGVTAIVAAKFVREIAARAAANGR